jgi:hypothetical protein
MTGPVLLALATLLAQAGADPGPAPAAPPTSAPAPAAPKPTGPAEPAPSETAGPAEPAPSEPGPSGAAAPASPPPPSSPIDLGPETPPRNIVALLGGVAYRLTSTALTPTVGFTIGGAYQRRYATLASTIELGWALEFAFDRFATGVIGSAPDANGVEQTYAATRTITSTSFAALHTLAVHQDRFRFWVGAGAGVSIGFLSSPELELRPGSASAYQPLARGAAGADLEINSQASVGLRAGYSFMLTSSALHTSSGPTFAFMGDLLDIQAGLFYRFR